MPRPSTVDHRESPSYDCQATRRRPLNADLREQKATSARLVNDEIREMAAEQDWLEPDWEFLCECGACWEHVALSVNEYDGRTAGDELILAPGHLFASAAEARQMARRLRNESKALRGQAQQAVRRAGLTARQATQPKP
jgi:hypothetical protein